MSQCFYLKLSGNKIENYEFYILTLLAIQNKSQNDSDSENAELFYTTVFWKRYFYFFEL